MTTKTVPLHELRPGDTITFPDAKVHDVSPRGKVEFSFTSGTADAAWVIWLEKIGVTATREVEPENEFDLTWAEALNQMVTHGATCEPDDGTGVRYQHVAGVWRVWVVSAAGGWTWVEILMHFTTPQQRQLTECKWRIVESNGN